MVERKLAVLVPGRVCEVVGRRGRRAGRRVRHAHPTLAEALKEAALDVDQRAIHA
mgnify:CR=1 FL=1